MFVFLVSSERMILCVIIATLKGNNNCYIRLQSFWYEKQTWHFNSVNNECFNDVSNNSIWMSPLQMTSLNARFQTKLWVRARDLCQNCGIFYNKNAFQWAETQHALGRGVCLPGGVCPGGCLPRGLSAQGVSAKGGVCPRRGGRHPPTLWTDRHLWKHHLRKLRLRAVIILESCTFQWHSCNCTSKMSKIPLNCTRFFWNSCSSSPLVLFV